MDLDTCKEYVNQRRNRIEFCASAHIDDLIGEVERLLVEETKLRKRIAELEVQLEGQEEAAQEAEDQSQQAFRMGYERAKQKGLYHE